LRLKRGIEMGDLKNPMRFSSQTREINIKKYLGEDKRVVELEIRPGNIYVHWEENE
jgi:hypothetical protein